MSCIRFSETIALPPPYILVGHSIGALYLRCYAGHHLDRLLGLVFLDGTHPLVPSVIRGRMPLPERARVVLAHAARLVGVVNRRALQITTTQAEMRLLSEASVQAARSRLDDLPLLVLTAGRRTEQELRGSEDPDHFMEVWMLLQRDLLRLSSRAVHRVLEEAGHCDLVTDSRHARWVGDEILEIREGHRSGSDEVDMCDTIVATARASAHGVLFGKNSDREYDEAQYLLSVPAAVHARGERLRLTYVEIDQAPQTFALLLSRPHWIWGAEIGANEHDLVIGNEAIFSKVGASGTPGVIGMDYLRLALERARDADEAIHVITTLLREHGQSGNCGYRRDFTYHNSFLIADRSGARVLETVDREWVVRGVPDYYAISNALTLRDEFDASSATLRSRVAELGGSPDAALSFKSAFEDSARAISGHHRHDRAVALLSERAGDLRTRDFFRILRDHMEGERVEGRAGPRICAHTRENPIGQTTASWVAELDAGRSLHWVTGTAAPCTGVFKPILMGIDLPEHGPTPGAVKNDASLWWRHEQLHRLLEQCASNDRARFDEERAVGRSLPSQDGAAAFGLQCCGPR